MRRSGLPFASCTLPPPMAALHSCSAPRGAADSPACRSEDRWAAARDPASTAAERPGSASVPEIVARAGPDAERRLARLAERTGRSKAFHLREMVESQLDRLEWEYGILADVEDIRAGRATTVPLDQVEADLGLDG